MADSIDIYLDLSKPQGGLFPSLNSRTPMVLGPFYQGALLKLRIFPVRDTGSTVVAPFFAKLPLSSLDLQVVVGPAAGGEAIKAAQYTWTKQIVPDTEGVSGYFYAELDLNTNEMNTLVGTETQISTVLEFLISRGGAFTAACQADIIVRAVVKTPGGAASIPTPAPSYLTADQCYALFVMWDNRLRAANNGRSPILTSPDGAHTREIGVDNDGSPTDNLT